MAPTQENTQRPAGGAGEAPRPTFLPDEVARLRREAAACRGGASWWRQVLLLSALLVLAWYLLRVVGGTRVWAEHRLHVLLALGGIACWRWAWFILQNGRAIYYRYWVFPRLRRAALRAVAEHGPVPEVVVLATTYHEKPWITFPVFESIFRELAALEGITRRSRVVVVTGGEDDDEAIQRIYNWCSDNLAPVESALWPPELVLLRGDKGKRPALATGMQEIARGNPGPDGVVIILDGDTLLGPDLLKKVLPLFRLPDEVHAVTTNENGFVKGPAWFAEWTSLRFGLRHRSMCSISLSGKLLCLTGRFSVFRASIATNPSFREQVERDTIHHWLWGSFEMLSGDDKSTWYWLARHGKRMLYVPDAMVTTYEVVTGSALHRALANVRRWSGNSVRHSWRAIRLGPSVVGGFAWWCLVDQRLTMATVLFGPAVAVLAFALGRYELVAGYLLWILFSRISHAAIAWRQGRRVSVYYVPLQIVSDWATALMKWWVLFHPAKQNWFNRGKRTLNTTQGSAFYGLRTGFAHYLYGFACVSLLLVVGLFVGLLPVFRDASLFLGGRPESAPTIRPAAPAAPARPAARMPLLQAGPILGLRPATPAERARREEPETFAAKPAQPPVPISHEPTRN
ncbi:MAG: hypothetical protein RJA22_2328 [Verrucomicrobiota bacterium]|jgi:glycosyltransferase Alg8